MNQKPDKLIAEKCRDFSRDFSRFVIQKVDNMKSQMKMEKSVERAEYTTTSWKYFSAVLDQTINRDKSSPIAIH